MDNNVINIILDKIILSDIVKASISLEKKGNEYLGLCPFHQEKTPSFTVNNSKGLFYCFGCQASGNAFTFLTKTQNIPFKEALQKLASLTGVSLQKNHSYQNTQYSLKDTVLKINRMAAVYYQSNLYKKDSTVALSYLTKTRKFENSIIQKFQLGCSSENRSFLSQYLLQEKFNESELYQSSLFFYSKTHTKQILDKFINKIIIPIHDINLNIIAFGSRVLDNSTPKYINTSENILFKKRTVLYGLPFALEKIKETKSIYITEGYFDVLAMHQFGITNTVATMGTSVNQEHLKEAKKYASHIVFMFDSDNAGKKAALKALYISLELHIMPEVILLSNNMDPYDYLFHHGSEKMYSIIDNQTLTWEDFLIRHTTEFQNPNEQSQELKLILEKLKSINPFLLNPFLKTISTHFNISPELLTEYFNLPKNKEINFSNSYKTTTNFPPSSSTSNQKFFPKQNNTRNKNIQFNSSSNKASKFPPSRPNFAPKQNYTTTGSIDKEAEKAQENMISLFIQHPDFYEKKYKHRISKLFFSAENLREVFSQWTEYYYNARKAGNYDFKDFFNLLNPSLKQRLSEYINEKEQSEEDIDIKIQKSENFLKRQENRKKIHEIQQMIQHLEKNMDKEDQNFVRITARKELHINTLHLQELIKKEKEWR